MRADDVFKRTCALTAACLLVSCAWLNAPVWARRHATQASKDRGSLSNRKGRHQARHHGAKSHHLSKTAAKPHYAYPLDMFIMEAPPQDLSLLPAEEALKIRYAFQSGAAANYSPEYLIRSGAVNYYALHGGMFLRRQPVKYIIVHSTETGVPQDARHVINSWSSGGRRHPAAQFIVDRDGTIFETVDPKYATVHVNIFKTLPGINNDDSIGIEMCHAGSENYTAEQKASVVRLVTYLQDRYHVLNENIVTHRYAQQGDHTDPVAFDWDGFLAARETFHCRALAMVHEALSDDMIQAEAISIDKDVPVASVYLEMHTALKQAALPPPRAASIQELQQTLQAAQASRPDTAAMRGTQVFPPAPTPTNALPLRGEIEVPPSSATTFDGIP